NLDFLSGDDTIKMKYDYDFSFYGNSSLKIEGKFSKNNFVIFNLFDTNIKIEKNLKIFLTIFGDIPNLELNINEEKIQMNPISKNIIQNDWIKLEYDLSKWENLFLNNIQISFFGNLGSTITSFIGQIKLSTNDIQPSPITEIKYTKSWNKKSLDVGEEILDY